jgi:hypothetical protein
MHICDQILGERRVGRTRCRVVDGPLNLAEAASTFGLADDLAVYRSIDRMAAGTIAVRILRAGLAHLSEIMPMSRAEHLWQQFLDMVQGQEVTYATNVGTFPTPWNELINETYSVNPATGATFDMGVLVFGIATVGCLWVEEED